MTAATSRKDLIAKARLRFKQSFDLSKLPDPVSIEEKVRIVCPEHGEFRSTMRAFFKSQHGCPLCRASSRVDRYWADVLQVHGDTYDYSQTVYRQWSDTLSILCRTHGLFRQSASNHKAGRGCPECAKDRYKAYVEQHQNDVRTPVISYPGYIEALRGGGFSMRPTKMGRECYQGYQTPIEHRCVQCGYKQTKTPDSLLKCRGQHTGKGCPRCAKLARGMKVREAVSIEGKIFHTDSQAEIIAIHFMLRKGIQTTEMLQEHDSGFTKILYRVDDKYHTYIPDFILPAESRVVEVKSPATLGLIDSRFGEPENLFKTAVAKFCGVAKRGLRPTLLVVERNGNVTVFPRSWFTDFTRSDASNWYRNAGRTKICL